MGTMKHCFSVCFSVLTERLTSDFHLFYQLLFSLETIFCLAMANKVKCDRALWNQCLKSIVKTWLYRLSTMWQCYLAEITLLIT